MPISDYDTSAADSISLAKIGEAPFTMVSVEDSNYTNGGESTPGVKITTKESFKVEGTEWNKFHTTRVALVSKLTREDIREAINSGKLNTPVKCVSQKGKNGRSYFDLVDA